MQDPCRVRSARSASCWPHVPQVSGPSRSRRLDALGQTSGVLGGTDALLLKCFRRRAGASSMNGPAPNGVGAGRASGPGAWPHLARGGGCSRVRERMPFLEERQHVRPWLVALGTAAASVRGSRARTACPRRGRGQRQPRHRLECRGAEARAHRQRRAPDACDSMIECRAIRSFGTSLRGEPWDLGFRPSHRAFPLRLWRSPLAAGRPRSWPPRPWLRWYSQTWG